MMQLIFSLLVVFSCGALRHWCSKDILDEVDWIVGDQNRKLLARLGVQAELEWQRARWAIAISVID